MPRTTVQEFIISFLNVRETYRNHFSKVDIYNQGTTSQPKGDSKVNDRPYKEGKKRKYEGQAPQKNLIPLVLSVVVITTTRKPVIWNLTQTEMPRMELPSKTAQTASYGKLIQREVNME
jgi:hypothetical protein